MGRQISLLLGSDVNPVRRGLSDFLCVEPYTARKDEEIVWRGTAREGFSKELLDQLLAGRDPKLALDSGGLIGDLKKALTERMLNAEMDVHLAREADAGEANHRNGSNAKTVLTADGAMELSIRR